MSKNKYKNNDSVNKRIKQPIENDGFTESESDELEENEDYEEWIEPGEESHQLLRQEVVEPSRERGVPHRVDTWNTAQSLTDTSEEIYGLDESSDGGVGEFKTNLAEEGISTFQILEDAKEGTEKETDGFLESDRDIDHRGARVPSKGFPWWWILLPLIILGLIWGITRQPTGNKTTPNSSTSQAPIQMMVVELPDYFNSVELL